MINRIEAVHNLAKKIVNQYNLEPPVDVISIFKKLGVKLEEESNQYGIEAYSVLDNELKVYINPELTYYEPRRRFTLAHELGHIIIPWHNGDIKGNPEDNYIKVQGKRLLDTQELEANIFASDILMPVDWMKNVLETYKDFSFQKIVEEVSSKAETSIMACFYALEYTLPSGYIYFVKQDNAEWWMLFSSKRTYTVNWFSFSDDRIDFFQKLCKSSEKFHIAKYEIMVFRMIPCPNRSDISRKYREENHNAERLIMKITNGHGERVLPFLDVILSEISEDNYIAFVYFERKLLKVIYDEKSLLNKFYQLIGYEDIIEIADKYGFDYKKITIGNGFEMIYILEKEFIPPDVKYSDPNIMLKGICKEIGYEKEKLQSINGIMASANGMLKNASFEELYNWCKYRLITDLNCEEFVLHSCFEEYLVNKCKKMIYMRR